MRRALALAALGLLAEVGCDAPGDDGPEGEGEGETGEGEPLSARFVAVGYGGRRLTSGDGEGWENDVEDVAQGGDDDRLLRGVCAGSVGGETVVLAVGGSARGRVLRSVDGGVTWTLAVDDDRGWIGACAIDDEGVVIFVGSARSARSLDGGRTLVDHAVQFFPAGGWQMRDATIDGGRFVAVGDLGVSTSDEGVTWSAPAGPRGLARIARGDVFGVTRFVMIGFGVRATSSDLVAFSEAPLRNGGDVVFFDDRFLIVADGAQQVSTDGVAFTDAARPALSRVAAGVVNGRTRLVGANFPDVRRVSDDGGATWRDVAREGENAIDDLVFVAGPAPSR